MRCALLSVHTPRVRHQSLILLERPTVAVKAAEFVSKSTRLPSSVGCQHEEACGLWGLTVANPVSCISDPHSSISTSQSLHTTEQAEHQPESCCKS